MKESENFVTVIDVGSSKICCLIAEKPQNERQELIIKGTGHQVSQGIENGSIVDMTKAEQSISKAVQMAENQANITIKNIIVNFFEHKYGSHHFKTNLPINDNEISDQDLRKIWQNCTKENIEEDKVILHKTPINYSVDGTSGISDPRGMHARQLEGIFHVVTADQRIVNNLRRCINRCHLEIEQIVLSPYASSIACINSDERRLGVTCIDIGGGTTSIATFVNEKFIFAKTLPIGGDNITKDLAKALSTSISDAERIKNIYGSAIATTVNEDESIDVPSLIGDEEGSDINQIPRSLLNGIIRPRLEEILEHVRGSLDHAGITQKNCQFVVATGGASQMTGLKELVSECMDMQTRIAKPINLSGLAEATSGSPFAAAVGLLEHAKNKNSGNDFDSYNFILKETNVVNKIIAWFKDNLKPL